MFKKTFSSLSVLSLFSLGIITHINAADLPALWLKVTADGVPGSAPSLNRIKAKGKKCPRCWKILEQNCNRCSKLS